MGYPMIILSGHLDIPADRRAAVAAALPAHIDLTRAEPGCLSFDVTEDPDRPGRYNVAERFATRPDFDAHQKRAAQSPWAEITAGIKRHYTIQETYED